MVRGKDGRKGVIFEEAPEMRILRNWARGIFTEEDADLAKKIHIVNMSIDLESLRKELSSSLRGSPKFASIESMVQWLDDIYFPSLDQEDQLLQLANSLLDVEHVAKVMSRWKSENKPDLKEFSPYSFYYYRVNTIYMWGLIKGFIKTSKKAKSHLDIQYIYYLPFSMAFTSTDNELKDLSQFFLRDNQMFIWGNTLKEDLQRISEHFNNFSDEEQKKFQLEYGNYPPDLPDSVTAEIWKTHMPPRPPQAGYSPKRSKEEDEKTLKEVKALIGESIDVEKNFSIDTRLTEEYNKRSSKEKSLMMLAKLGDLFDLAAGNTWSYVKKNLSGKEVKEFYEFYGDLWRPDSDIWKYYLREESKFSAIYVGDIGLDSVNLDLLGMSLYFDKILVVDPFQNPWMLKGECNPISKPELFEGDLLKLFNFLLTVAPFIESDNIELTQDPTDFSIEFKKECLAFGIERAQSWVPNEEEKAELAMFEDGAEADFKRFLCRLPPEIQKRKIQATFPKMDAELLGKYIEKIEALRAEDPLVVDRYFSDESAARHGNLIVTRAGLCLEVSCIISRLLGAVPLTNLAVRKNEFLAQKDESATSGRWASFLDRINSYNFRYLVSLHPKFAWYLSSKGYLASFRAFMGRVYNQLHSSERCSDKLVVGFTEELDQQLKALDKEWIEIEQEFKNWNEGPSALGIGERALFFDIDDVGYSSLSVAQLVDKFVKEERLKVPRVSMFIQMPRTFTQDS